MNARRPYIPADPRRTAAVAERRGTAPADELRDLARQLRRLGPDHRDPERFHVDRDEMAAALQRLARRLETR